MFAIFAITKSSLQLIERDSAVAVFVNRLEDLFELCDVVGVGLDRDGHQGHLFQFLGLLELLDVAEVELAYDTRRIASVLSLMLAHKAVLEGLAGS